MPFVLLADDSLPIQRQVQSTLQGLDLQLVMADSVESALGAAERQKPALILLDYQLPLGGSTAFLRGLDSRRILCPVIVLLNPLQDYDEARARRDGAAGVSIKPFDPIALQELVAKYCPEAWPNGTVSEVADEEFGHAAIHRIRHALRQAMPGLGDAELEESGLGLQSKVIEGTIQKVILGFFAAEPLHPALDQLLRELVQKELARILPAIVRQEVRARIATIENESS